MKESTNEFKVAWNVKRSVDLLIVRNFLPKSWSKCFFNLDLFFSFSHFLKRAQNSTIEQKQRNTFPESCQRIKWPALSKLGEINSMLYSLLCLTSYLIYKIIHSEQIQFLRVLFYLGAARSNISTKVVRTTSLKGRLSQRGRSHLFQQ